jgi:hypothetical protein
MSIPTGSAKSRPNQVGLRPDVDKPRNLGKSVTVD